MNVLITGGNGLLGRHLVPELQGRGDAVRVLTLPDEDTSWTVYGMNLGRPAHEDFPLRPFHEPYAVTKAEGDRLIQRLIREAGLPAVIIRPGTFFGPGDRLHFGRTADRLRAGRGLIVG